MDPENPLIPIDSGFAPPTGVNWGTYLEAPGFLTDGPSFATGNPEGAAIPRPELDGGASFGPCPSNILIALLGAGLGYWLGGRSRLAYAGAGAVAGYLLAPHVCALLGKLGVVPKLSSGMGSTDHPPRRRGRNSDY